MLFKPEVKDDAKTAGKRVARGIGRRMVSLTIALLILGGLGYLGWNAFQQKQSGRGGPGARPDLPVPVLAATPRTQDVPVLGHSLSPTQGYITTENTEITEQRKKN